MVYVLLQSLNIFLIILSVVCLYIKYKQAGMSMLLSITSWFMVYFVFYFLIPSAFLENISIKGHWGFSDRTIIYSRLIVCSTFLMYLGMYCSTRFAKQHTGIRVADRMSIVYIAASFFFVLSIVLTSLFILNIIKDILGKDFLSMYIELRDKGEKLQKKYQIKKVLYLGIASMYYLYLRERKKRYFLLIPFFLVSDFLGGSRTNSFVFILFTYFLLVKESGKTYLKQIIVVFIALLSLAMITRASALANEGLSVGTFVAFTMGEFTQTYLTLPYIIQNDLIGLVDLQKLSFGFFSTLLPGFVQSKLQFATNFYGYGNDISIIVGRGYGLGCNYITELVFSLGLWALVLLPLVYLLIQYLDDTLYNDQFFILKILIVIRLRLFVREGVPGMMTLVYIFIMYFSFFFFFRKKGDIACKSSGA